MMGIGVFNKEADKVKRIDKTWSDTNLDNEIFERWSKDGRRKEKRTFNRLVCRNCGNKMFEILDTGSYETSAKCSKCGMYYIVHSG